MDSVLHSWQSCARSLLSEGLNSGSVIMHSQYTWFWYVSWSKGVLVVVIIFTGRLRYLCLSSLVLCPHTTVSKLFLFPSSVPSWWAWLMFFFPSHKVQLHLLFSKSRSVEPGAWPCLSHRPCVENTGSCLSDGLPVNFWVTKKPKSSSASFQWLFNEIATLSKTV